MKRKCIVALAVLALIMMIGLVRNPNSAAAQEDDSVGWLEGSVKDIDGKGLDFWSVQLFKPDGTALTDAASVGTTGGLFAFKNVKPGIYEIRVVALPATERGSELRQQRIWGVPIKKGVRSILAVRLNEGKNRDLEEIGKPNVPTAKVGSLSEDIETIKAEIEDLKKQIASLRK